MGAFRVSSIDGTQKGAEGVQSFNPRPGDLLVLLAGAAADPHGAGDLTAVFYGQRPKLAKHI